MTLFRKCVDKSDDVVGRRYRSTHRPSLPSSSTSSSPSSNLHALIEADLAFAFSQRCHCTLAGVRQYAFNNRSAAAHCAASSTCRSAPSSSLPVLALFSPFSVRALTHNSNNVAAASSASTDMIDSSNIASAFGNVESDVDSAAMNMMERFITFKAKYSRTYLSDEIEANRYNIFATNMNIAKDLSMKVPSATFGENQFADIDALEFKRIYLNYKPLVGDDALLRMNRPVRKSRGSSTIPASFDWRRPDQGRPVAVTPVKDQGVCGSCWAFSAIESVESAYILKYKTVELLSPQQTVDCDQTSTDQAAVIRVARTPGVYATPGCNDACVSQNEDLLAQNLYLSGPVSICLDATPWHQYTGGIMTNAACSTNYFDTNHCVELVGYGTDIGLGQKYWSVRNSWGAEFGEAGYIRLLYGQNTCGVADEAVQPLIV